MLVVDDDPAIRLILLVNLEAEGLAVEVAEDGRSGLESRRRRPPDVVVLDGMMPDLDGTEVLGALRADPATAHLPVVLLSARTDDEQVWAGWRAGADYYVTKPFVLDDLLTLVHRLAYESSAAGPPSSRTD